MPTRRSTVATYAEHWLRTSCAPPYTSRYVSRHRSIVLRGQVLPYIGELRLEQVTPAKLAIMQRKLFDRGLKLATVQTAIQTVFASMWSAARREGLVTGSPTRELRWPRAVRELPDAFSREEVLAICAYFRAHHPAFALYVEILAWTGARPSEISALHLADIDLAKGRASIRAGWVRGEETSCKTARSVRTIVLAPRLQELIRRRWPADPVDPAEHLCRSPRGVAIDGWAMGARQWATTLAALGIRHRKLYCLRHSYISAALTAGAAPQAVADYVGSSPAMLQRHYARWMPGVEGDPLTLATEASAARDARGPRHNDDMAQVGTVHRYSASVTPRNNERFEAQDEPFPSRSRKVGRAT